MTRVKEPAAASDVFFLAMARKFPIHPANPHRVCWGCDRYCAADSMVCGNGSVRTLHPVELFGDDWDTWQPERDPPEAPRSAVRSG